MFSPSRNSAGAPCCVVSAKPFLPEGDTVHKLAAALAPDLLGHPLLKVELRRLAGAPLMGSRCRRVDAQGKHLLLHFDNALTLRSHLGLHGAWHRYRRGEAWRKPRRQAGILLETAEHCLVCFNPREVELVATGRLAESSSLARLGPDLLGDHVDFPALVARARRQCDVATQIIDLLLDQSLAAGIGNVYKSELLFLHRLHPQAALGTVDDGRLLALYRLAAELLRQNLRPGRRRTRFVDDGGPKLWVYKRRNRPCLNCGTPIQRELWGKPARSCYWCPSCQAPERH